jgi:hypothetical protein
MLFMSEWEIDETYHRLDDEATPNLARAALILVGLVAWTNRNSDGWAYWRKPGNAAKSLMTLIQSVDRHNPTDVTPAEVRRAVAPIRAFFTRQGISRALTDEILGVSA